MATSLTVEERRQASSLHSKKALGNSLTESEEQLVARFYATVDAEEAARLQPTRERQEQRITEMDAQIHDMQSLLVREEAFLNRLQTTLAEIAQERQEILREKQRILSRTAVTLG